jgi:hypothetical protein
MIFTAPLPTIKVWVQESYLTGDKLFGTQEAYLVGVKSQANEALKFTVHLNSGALWSGLPIEAVGMYEDFHVQYGTDVLQPFSCLEGSIQVIQYPYLINYEAEASLFVGDEKRVLKGSYLFTIDVQGQGLSNDPEQYKTHNVIELHDSGQLAALPNNYCRFIDKHFVDKVQADKVQYYKRASTKFYAGS